MRWILACLAVTAACSKQSDPPSNTAPSGSAPAPAPPATPVAKPAPAMTPALFVTEPTKFTIEALDRGLWISDNGGAFQHMCRVELGMAMARAGKLRAVAMKSPDAAKCEPKGAHTVCTVVGPEGQASWVFVTDDDTDEIVLTTVLFGTYDWAAIEPKLPPKQPCPRPSANP